MSGNLERHIENLEDHFQTIAEKVKLRRQRQSEIIRDEKDINMDLFKEYFNYESPSKLLKDVYNTNKKKNNDLVNMIKNRVCDLEKEIEKISENEKEVEKPNEIVDIVERILYLIIRIKKDKDKKY